MFEDDALDVYMLAEVGNTIHSYGLNHDDAHFEKQLKMHPHKRDKKYPTVEDFWNSTEPTKFKLWCGAYAQYRKFKKWFNLKIKDASNIEDMNKHLQIKFESKYPLNWNYDSDYTH